MKPEPSTTMETREFDALCERIAALEAENARLRQALARIDAWYDQKGLWTEGDEPRSIARHALGEGGGGDA